MINLIPLAQRGIETLIVPFIIALALLWLSKWAMDKAEGIDSVTELAERDNFAYGISLAGRMLALAIILITVIAQDEGGDVIALAQYMSLYGFLGLGLIILGRSSYDSFTLDRLDNDELILKRNMGIALLDAGSSIATGVILASVIHWSNSLSLGAILALLAAVIVAQSLLLIMTRWYEWRFAHNNQGLSMQEALRRGQDAVGLQQGGILIGTAIAIGCAGHLMIFDPETYISNTLGWFLTGLALAIVFNLLLLIARKALLFDINLSKEIDLQHNIGIAAIEFVLALFLGGLMSALLG